eukprot:sb/3464750/
MSRKGCSKVKYDSDDSDSGDSQSVCESLASEIEDHEHDLTFDNLLDCFGFREIINEDIDNIQLTEGEALLMDFLRKTDSLSVIKEVLQQNEELAKQLCDKVYPKTNEKTCSKYETFEDTPTTGLQLDEQSEESLPLELDYKALYNQKDTQARKYERLYKVKVAECQDHLERISLFTKQVDECVVKLDSTAFSQSVLSCSKVKYDSDDSDSGDSQSVCESLASEIEDHEHDLTFDNLLDCFGFREIINEDIDNIQLTEGEALLMDFLRKTDSLSVIKELFRFFYRRKDEVNITSIEPDETFQELPMTGLQLDEQGEESLPLELDYKALYNQKDTQARKYERLYKVKVAECQDHLERILLFTKQVDECVVKLDSTAFSRSVLIWNMYGAVYEFSGWLSCKADHLVQKHSSLLIPPFFKKKRGGDFQDLITAVAVVHSHGLATV